LAFKGLNAPLQLFLLKTIHSLNYVKPKNKKCHL